MSPHFLDISGRQWPRAVAYRVRMSNEHVPSRCLFKARTPNVYFGAAGFGTCSTIAKDRVKSTSTVCGNRELQGRAINVFQRLQLREEKLL